MQDQIADSLVLVFTEGMSLRAWRDTGMLEREWALYQRLASRYGRIVLVTYGGQDEERVLASVAGPEISKVTVISNQSVRPVRDFATAVPTLVLRALGGLRSAVVKTNQMAGGEVAVAIAHMLRDSGQRVGLVARGGYLWSRFVAFEAGANSPQHESVARRERALCDAADLVVGTTAAMLEDLAWRYHLPQAKTRLIPNYVLTEPPPVIGERERGVVLYAGQLVARKRVAILIEAVSLLDPELRERTTLEVIGEGSERAALEAQAARLNVKCVFKNRVPHTQLLERMRACSLYVQASELEGHPKTVIEAMASGAAVVIADSPGLAEVVSHGVTGICVQPEPQAFAHAMGGLLDDASWRETLGAAAATQSREMYGIGTIVELEASAHESALAFGSERAGMRATA